MVRSFGGVAFLERNSCSACASRIVLRSPTIRVDVATQEFAVAGRIFNNSWCRRLQGLKC